MISTKKFDAMRKELDEFDHQREKIIEQSRDIIKVSKLAIYAVQRDALHEASKHITRLKKLVSVLPLEHFDTGIATTARQEYVEALTFYYFMKESKLIYADELGVTTYEYLLGLCDLSGELMRKAINCVIKNKIDDAVRIRDFVDELYHYFLKFNLRNGELRKKSDQIKWNLEKLENVLYDLTVSRRLNSEG